MPDDDRDPFDEMHPCPECQGDGVIPDDGSGERYCANCGGSGVDPDSMYDDPED